MLDVVLLVGGVLVVAALLFLGASVLLGRGETRPAADPERSPVELPVGRAVTGDDVRALRMTVSLRGYRMSEVDWLLDQLARTLDERDGELAALRVQLHPAPAVPAKPGEEPAADDGPAAVDDEESRHA
ncbi:DivIVA domain-containing protein [Blastococcus sp. CCUG 61487]|uniref:DivIVA domain-containing protein n=1 Tax=Blastococcus sp. CCUG 61487 TaxID=1840703 RepID=UPI0010BFC5C9|nr:DivIVA domain-containing protein [Blastococcus sp. CCUG 61487]TKJ19015.1 cell division protein DivIVA [Blastococcus sp. CCUG 61487]